MRRASNKTRPGQRRSKVLLKTLWLALFAGLFSCFEPQIVDGQFTCQEPPHLCPEDQECQADCVCRSPDSEPPPDAPTDCENIE